MKKTYRVLLVGAALVVVGVGLAGLARQVEGCAGCGCKGGAEALKPAATKAAADDEAAASELSTQALATLLRSKVPATVLDARTAKGDDGRRIPGAKSLTADATEDQIKALLPKKDGLVVTYCGSRKCTLSNKLAGRLKGLGYTNVREYSEGIKGWAAAGQDVQQQVGALKAETAAPGPVGRVGGCCGSK